MKKSIFPTFIILMAIAILIASCGQNKPSVKTDDEFTEKVFVVNILQNEQKLKEYLNYHQHIWPEVEAGFKKAGYKKITLYRYNHLLVMIIVVPKNADLGAMGKLAESYNPRCAEWNKLMDGYQEGVSGTKPGQKWVETKPFYEFRN